MYVNKTILIEMGFYSVCSIRLNFRSVPHAVINNIDIHQLWSVNKISRGSKISFFPRHFKITHFTSKPHWMYYSFWSYCLYSNFPLGFWWTSNRHRIHHRQEMGFCWHSCCPVLVREFDRLSRPFLQMVTLIGEGLMDFRSYRCVATLPIQEVLY